VGKKKATGMSKRLGFTDRQTIAENKDILRYNERLEREAKGLPPDEPSRGGGRGGRDGRGGRPERAEGGSRPAGAARPERSPRPPRPVRPPALDDAQRAVLEAALAEAVGETGLEAAGNAVITRIAAHDSFERASAAGWEIAAGGHAAERTEQEWELVRKTWLTLRFALLEAYAGIKPELEATLARERKLLVRIDKPARRGRRDRPEKPAGEAREGREGRRRRPKHPGGMPSPADVARKLAPAADATATATADVVASVLAVETGELAEITPVETSAPIEPAAPQVAEPQVAPASDESVADSSELEAVAADADGAPAEPEFTADLAPDEGRAVAEELRVEHGAAPLPEGEPDPDKDQLHLDF
jgi:ribonuclease E